MCLVILSCMLFKVTRTGGGGICRQGAISNENWNDIRETEDYTHLVASLGYLQHDLCGCGNQRILSTMPLSKLVWVRSRVMSCKRLGRGSWQPLLHALSASHSLGSKSNLMELDRSSTWMPWRSIFGSWVPVEGQSTIGKLPIMFWGMGIGS